MNLFKKLGVKKEGRKPGELLSALNANKAKHGGVALFKTNHKKHMCTHCEKSCSTAMHHEHHKHSKSLRRDGHKEKRREKHEKRDRKDDGESDAKFDREAEHEESTHKKSRKKNWIAGAIKHPGALHREMGVKEGNKIPARRLVGATKKGGKIGKRARLAETLKGLHHKKESKKKHKGGPVADQPSLQGFNPSARVRGGWPNVTYQSPTGSPMGGSLSGGSFAKRRSKGKKYKIGPQQPLPDNPMVGSVGGFKKRSKHRKHHSKK